MLQAIRKKIEKSRWTVTDSGRRSRDRRLTVKQRFSTFQAIRKLFCKNSPKGHATVVGGHATVGRLSSTYMHVYNNNEREREREKERERERVSERERERKREKERERERQERERDRILPRIRDGESLTTRPKSAKKFTWQFSRVLTPRPQALSGFSRESPAGDKYVVLRRLCL